MSLKKTLITPEYTMTKRKRIENDYYPTPSKLTEALLSKVSIPKTDLIFEPCCGEDQAIAKVFFDRDYTVISSDITINDDKPRNATTSEFWDYWHHMNYDKIFDWTVTNPPFNQAPSILPLALEYSHNVAMLLRLSYIEPCDTKQGGFRGQWLDDHKDNLRYFIPISPRPKFRSDTSGSDSVTTAWFVWQNNFSWQFDHGIESPFQFIRSWK